MNIPHCYSKMNWILKYPIGMEPAYAICNCHHGSFKCNLLTRQRHREKLKNVNKNGRRQEDEINL